MKRALALTAVVAMTLSAFAGDPREERRTAIRDLLHAIGFHTTDDEEQYGPVLDQMFSPAEMRQVATFANTFAGQKFIALLPQLVAEKMKAAEAKQQEPWQKTMTDLRTIATAAEAYATDENKYPDVTSYESLSGVLSPTYIKTVPERDAWGTPYLCVVSSDRQHYRFVSAGADQHFESGSYRIEEIGDNFEPRVTDSPHADIIFQDGTFVQFPAAAKRDLQ